MQKQEKKFPFGHKDLIKNYMTASSSKDCTGLIPAGGNLTDDEFDSYKELYPFAVPKMPDEYDDNKELNDAKRFNRF